MVASADYGANNVRRLGLSGALTIFVVLAACACLWAQEDIATLLAKASAGDPAAQDTVGLAYAMGSKDVPRNYTAAAKWFRKAALQGYADSQFRLGALYELGRGVAQDRDEALKWYLLAAKQGQARAQLKVGGMYEQGRGVSQSFAEAASWYHMAAEQGNSEAQFKLGHLYEQGLGVPLNNAEAVNWYQKAAAKGNLEATRALVALGAK